MSSSNTKQQWSGRTLSKDALYAPLSSYLNELTTATDFTKAPTTTPKMRSLGSYIVTGKNIPVNLRQSSLVDWIEKVGEHYHATQFNSGGKSLRKTAIESRLLQRSVLMIGGGIHNPTSHLTTLSTTSTDAKKRLERKIGWRQKRGYQVVSNKKRKRIKSNLESSKNTVLNTSVDMSKSGNEATKEGLQSAQSAQKVANITELPSFENFLIALHRIWSQYAQHATKTCTTIQELSCTLSSLEPAGAIACILECPSLVPPQQNFSNRSQIPSTKSKKKHRRKKKNKITLGMNIMILSETKNTWNVISLTPGEHDTIKNWSNQEKKSEGNRIMDNGTFRQFNEHDIIMVPKRNTKLGMIMNVSSLFLSTKKKNQKDENHERIQIIINGQGD